MKKFIATLAALVGILAGGIAIYRFFFVDENGSNGGCTAPPRSKSFLERVSGSYRLVSWDEVVGPITLGIDARSGTLDIDQNGDARWELVIQQRGDHGVPRSRIRCRGRVRSSSRQLEGVPGPGNEAVDWDNNIESVRDHVWLTFAGWSTQRPPSPFSLHIQEREDGRKILEMRNSKGTFTWSS